MQDGSGRHTAKFEKLLYFSGVTNVHKIWLGAAKWVSQLP